MFMISSFKAGISRYTQKDARKKVHSDEYEDDCPNDYEDYYDYDHCYDIEDDAYTTFVEERQSSFFKNISHHNIFTRDFVEKLKSKAVSVSFSWLSTEFKVGIEDLMPNSKSKIVTYLNNIFEDGNKFGLYITLKLVFTNTSFTKISMFQLSIGHDDKSFINYNSRKDHPIHNGYRRKHASTLESIINYMVKEDFPDYCLSNEDCLMYFLYHDHYLIRDGSFTIQNILFDQDYFELFKMSIY